jgi:hypothetical protein
VRWIPLIPVNLVHGGPAAADMGMIMEYHIRILTVLHAMDLQPDPVSGFKYVS